MFYSVKNEDALIIPYDCYIEVEAFTPFEVPFVEANFYNRITCVKYLTVEPLEKTGKRVLFNFTSNFDDRDYIVEVNTRDELNKKEEALRFYISVR
jgi:hypothetical protein